MVNFDLNVTQTAGKIECDFSEIKEALAIQMSAYSGLTVTEDSIPEFKKELATLRKIWKAVDDRRKELKEDFMSPYNEFEGQVKTLLEEIDKPIKEIDTQIKMFAEEKAQAKAQVAKEIYDNNINGLEEFLPFDLIFNPKWTNVSYSEKDITFDIGEKVVAVRNDLKIIESLNSEINDELIKVYKKTRDLKEVINRNQQYLKDKEVINAIQKDEQCETKHEEKPTVKSNTASIIISLEDLDKVLQTLDFMEVKYKLIKGE